MTGHDMRVIQDMRCDRCKHKFGNHEGEVCYAYNADGTRCTCTTPVKFPALGWLVNFIIVGLYGSAAGGF